MVGKKFVVVVVVVVGFCFALLKSCKDARPMVVPLIVFQQCIQGVFYANKISGLGVDFGHLVRCLLLGNKVEARKPSLIFS